MNKHTPGPWTAVRWNDNESDTYGWSFSAGGYSLPLDEVETDNPDECDANARLIASAPDLLKWLTEAVKTFGPEQHELRDRARAAIAKATSLPS
ncbi:MAG: hypothetical protein ACRC7C_19710 [Beijerinckiaceae bacterium]